jgi:5-methyltetrahydrofolate--homocysteine methyltransferase
MEMKPYRDLHLFAAGGCCGTTPEFIKLLNSVFAGCVPGRPAHKMPSVLCTPVDFVNVDGITVVGERINPTGKKRFQQALREEDMNYVLEQAVSQVEAGAQVLDVNVGGRACPDAQGGQGPAERHQPAAAAGFLQCAGTGKRPARL